MGVDDGSGARPGEEFGRVGPYLRVAAGVAAVAAVVAVAVEGVTLGLSAAMVVRWVGTYLVVLLLCAAVTVALDAYRRADLAQRRGERLAGEDVGLLPPRPRRLR